MLLINDISDVDDCHDIEQYSKDDEKPKYEQYNEYNQECDENDLYQEYDNDSHFEDIELMEFGNQSNTEVKPIINRIVWYSVMMVVACGMLFIFLGLFPTTLPYCTDEFKQVNCKVKLDLSKGYAISYGDKTIYSKSNKYEHLSHTTCYYDNHREILELNKHDVIYKGCGIIIGLSFLFAFAGLSIILGFIYWRRDHIKLLICIQN
jgi:hypothetical protein